MSDEGSEPQSLKLALGQGDKAVKECRNIDHIVDDATICITTVNLDRPMDWSGIPEVSDEVSLGSDQEYTMGVEVTWISQDRRTFRGTVTRGYFPDDRSKWITEGDRVEFSRNKIEAIDKKTWPN